MLEPKNTQRNFHELVFTGGPAAGKTTILAHAHQRFADRGVRTLLVPEVPTIVFTGGISDIARIAAEEPRQYLEIQRQMMLMLGGLRKRYRALAASFAPDPVVIIYDRGEMDFSAYIDQRSFDAILAEHHLTLAQVRDSYDGVIHLRSSAHGAPDHYTTANNEARREDVNEAREADARTLRCWLGHPHLRIVPAYEDFEEKKDHVFRTAAHLVGLPAPVEIERKYLLASPPDFAHPMLREAVAVELEQTYLTPPDPMTEVRVRRRSQNGQASYFWTSKSRDAEAPPEQRAEREALITPSEYVHLLRDADPDHEPLRKRRYCFVYGNAHFELDEIPRDGAETLWLLEAELLEAGEQVDLPDFLDVEREVTGELAYESSHLAATPAAERD